MWERIPASMRGPMLDRARMGSVPLIDGWEVLAVWDLYRDDDRHLPIGTRYLRVVIEARSPARWRSRQWNVDITDDEEPFPFMSEPTSSAALATRLLADCAGADPATGYDQSVREWLRRLEKIGPLPSRSDDALDDLLFS